jgi:DNA repair exonuclease SbcCD ATPase subunit
MLPTYTLPKPQSESVKYIFHLSDIHIRNGDSVVTRYSEYKTVFDSIVNYFQTVSKDTVVVITGDIFHNKNSLGASGIKLFTELVLKLAASAPVYIIRGNHDYRQDKPEEPDMILPFMNMFPDNVVYMDKEGYYQVNEDIGFALMPIQQTLQSGSTCGSVENLPPFPPAEGLQTKTKVALFHGSIPQRIPLSWFGTGWDYILLGDIHAQNIYGGTQLSGLLDPKPTAEGIYKIGTINRNDKNTLWGYPGSTVQQGFGETILGHGFCIWDLQQKHVELYHVANQSGCIDVKKVQDVWSVKLSHPLYTEYVPIKQAVKLPWFPKNVYVRVKGEYDVVEQHDLMKLFEACGIQHHQLKTAPSDDWDTDEGQVPTDIPIMESLADLNTPAAWTKYIQTDSNQEQYTNWSTWIQDPSSLLLKPIPDMVVSFNSKIEDRNQRIISAIETFKSTLQQKTSASIHLLKFAWSWILCYADNCFVDFELMDKQITVINGKNGSGKTSFLESLCIGLFGSGFPSRIDKNSSGSIICQQKVENQASYTDITFNLNSKSYRLSRSFKFKSDNTNTKLHAHDVYLYDMSAPETPIKTGKNAVDIWVKENIGTIETFLQTTMVNQDADGNFFDLKINDQKKQIDEALCMNTTATFKAILKEASLAYIALLKEVEAVQSVLLLDPLASFDPSLLDQLKKEVDQKHSDISQLVEFIDKTHTTSWELDLLSNGYEWISQEHTSLVEYRDKLGERQEQRKYADFQAQTLLQRGINTQLTKTQVLDQLRQLAIVEEPEETFEIVQTKLQELQAVRFVDEKELKIIQDNLDHLHTQKEQTVKSIAKNTTLLKESEEKLKDQRKQLDTWYAKQPPQPSRTKQEYDEYQEQLNQLTTKWKSPKQFETKHKKELVQPTVPKPICSAAQLHELDIQYQSWCKNNDISQIKTELESTVKAIQNKESVILQLSQRLETYTVQKQELVDKKDSLMEENSNLQTVAMPKYWNDKTRYDKDYQVYTKLLKDHDLLASSAKDYKIKDIPKYQLIVEKGLEYINDVNDLTTRCRTLKQMFDGMEQHPYNPDCEACRKQPWRIKFEETDLELQTLAKELCTKRASAKKLFGADIDIKLYKQAQAFLGHHNKYTAIQERMAKEEAFWTQYTDQEEQYKAYQAKRSALKSELDKVSQQLQTLNANTTALHNDLSTYKKDLQQLQTKHDKLMTVLNEYNTKWAPMLSDKATFQIWTTYESKLQAYEQTKALWDKLIDDGKTVWKHCLQQQKALQDWNTAVAQTQGAISKLDTEIASLRSTIDKHQSLLESLRDKITTEQAKLGRLQTDYESYLQRKHFEALAIQWTKYTRYVSQYTQLQDTLKYIDIQEQITKYDDGIVKCKRFSQLHNALEQWPEWIKLNTAKTDLDTLRTEHQDMLCKLALLEDSAAKHQKVAQNIQSISELVSTYKATIKEVDWLEELIGVYQSTVFEKKALPVICSKVNQILGCMCQNHRQIGLTFKTTPDGELNWMLQDGINTPPLAKASGFQKFAVSLAMRITLGKLGVSGLNCRQLFLDEGFTACDGDNLSSVPEFINGLLANMFDMVILVTHIEELKSLGNLTLNIERNEQKGTSKVVFGNPAQLTRKKRGRPRKHDI